MLTRWLSRGARRMLGELPPEPLSLYNRAVAGRNATAARSTSNVEATGSGSIVQENGSNVPERSSRSGPGANSSARRGTPLASLTPRESRAAGRIGPIALGQRDRHGRSRENSVAAGLRHLRPWLHALRGGIGARKSSQRDRGDAQPADAILRVRRGAQHGTTRSRPCRARHSRRRRCSMTIGQAVDACSGTPSAGHRRPRSVAWRRGHARSQARRLVHPRGAGRSVVGGLMKPEFQLIY